MILGFFKGLLNLLLALICVLLVLSFAALVVFILINLCGWSLGSSLLFLLMLVGAGGLGWYLLRLRRQRKETRLFNATAEAAAEAQAQKKEAYCRARALWNCVVQALRSSQLALKGNPLYEQPWGVILGGSGAGKTTAVRGSRLVSNLGTGTGKLAGEELPCSVWFLRDMTLIDPQGAQTGAGEANHEFEYLLDILASARSREPLNAVVLTVGADALLQWHADDLQLYGRQLSAEVEQIYRRFGCSIPVYVLVTKLDLVYGMRELAQALPDGFLSQAMGCVNPNPSRPAEAYLDESFEEIMRHLRHLRLHLAYDCTGGQAAIAAAPDGVAALLPGLRAFVRGVFTANPYQHALPLRGLFFGSGGGEGEPVSGKLRELGITPLQRAPEEDGWEKDSRQVMFLGDFFGRILPADRGYYKPLPEFARLSAVKNNIGALTVLCLGFACSLFLSAAFLKQYSVLSTVTENSLWQALPDYPHSQITTLPGDDELARVVYTLSDLNRQLQALDAQEKDLWWTRPLMLGGMEGFRRQLEASYARQFRQYVINVIDLRINRDDPLGQQRGGLAERTGAYYEYVVRRCNLSRLGAQKDLAPGVFTEYPAPTASILRALGCNLPADTELMLPQLYERYYLCQHDKVLLADESTALNRELVALLQKGPATLDWLVPWANQLDGLQDITLQEFWRGSYPSVLASTDHPNGYYIPRGYTADGSKQILSFVRQINEAVLSAKIDQLQRGTLTNDVNQRAATVFKLYKQQAYAAWLDFAGNMPLGRGLLNSEDELMYAAGNCAALNGPYEKFLDRLQTELFTLAAQDIRQLPGWMRLVVDYRKLRVEASASRLVGSSATYVGAAVNYASQVGNMLRQQPSPLVMPQVVPTPAAAFADYCKGLLQSGPPPGSLVREIAYGKSSVLFGGKGALPQADPAAGGAPAADPAAANPATQQNQSLKQAVDGFLLFQKARHYDNATAEELVIWRCMRGPLDLVVEYNLFEGARVANRYWSDTVLADISSIPPLQVPQELFDKNQGRVWRWLKGAGTPFFASDTQNNYMPKIVAGYKFPLLYDQISPVLTKGARGSWGLKQQYSLSITALPIDVNERATTLPTGATLTLFAAEGPQTLRNLNYASARTFLWKPAEGGRTELRIEFPTFALIKTYDGPYGFARFAGDFTQGTHVFTPTDFPEAEQLLRDMCIRYIKVGYVFDSQQMEPIIRINSLFEVSVPAQAAPDFAQWQQDFRDHHTVRIAKTSGVTVEEIHFAPISSASTSIQNLPAGGRAAPQGDKPIPPQAAQNPPAGMTQNGTAGVAPASAALSAQPPAAAANLPQQAQKGSPSPQPAPAGTAQSGGKSVDSGKGSGWSLFGLRNQKKETSPAATVSTPPQLPVPDAGGTTRASAAAETVPGIEVPAGKVSASAEVACVQDTRQVQNVFMNTTKDAGGQTVITHAVDDLPELSDRPVMPAPQIKLPDNIVLVDRMPDNPVPGKVYVLRASMAEISCEPGLQLAPPVYAPKQ